MEIQATSDNCPDRADDRLNNGSSFNNLLENAEGSSSNNSDETKIGTNEGESRVRKVVEAAISEKSRKIIDNILEEMKALTPVELLFLYLKLPTECSSSVDPLQKPMNPLGSRSEINRTITWIKTHLEEDPDLSLPKQDVYLEYCYFCGANAIKPLSTADFGKVMKQVYPKVIARRLGTRGHSRYCYAGLRGRLKLEVPSLPDLSDKPQSTEPPCGSAELFAAAWSIVKEWSEHQLGSQFPSLHALAAYLVLNCSIGQGTAAATMVTSVAKSQLKGDAPSWVSSVCGSKHREAQLQLQRKIQQNREGSKRKLQVESKGRTKKCKVQNQGVCTSIINASPTSASATSDGNQTPPEGLRPVCDKSLPLPDFHSLQKSVADLGATDTKCDLTSDREKASSSYSTGNGNGSDAVPKTNSLGKMPIPRLNSSIGKASPTVSPKRVKSAKYKTIQPKPEPCDIPLYNPQANLNTVDSRSQENINNSNNSNNNTNSNGSLSIRKTSKRPKSVGKMQDIKTEVEEKVDSLTSIDLPLSRERLRSISQVDKDALDDYLGTNNSQEHEEELMKYFDEQQEQSNKLSQLRQLLEKNGHHANGRDALDTRISLASLLNSSNQSAFTKTAVKEQNDVSPMMSQISQAQPVAQLSPAQHLNARRRVSFETSQYEETVPQSPSTRPKNFIFVPISPGPVSPGGRQSKCSSTTASPFVSPRNTPVPRAKANIHQTATSSFVSGAPTNLLNITSSRKQTKLSLKVKQEPDLQLEPDRQLSITTNVPGYTAMSAPPSPKVKSKNTSNLLQQLLNSKNRITNVSDSVQVQNSTISKFNDPLSSEVSQLLSTGSSSSDLVTVEVGLRSQSVPLHQMSVKSDPNLTSPLTPSGCMTQFPFGVGPADSSVNNTPIPNEFNDYDTFSGTTENINMNKILNALDNCSGENVLATSEAPNAIIHQTEVFGNMVDMDLSLNNNLNSAHMDRDGFEIAANMNFVQDPQSTSTDLKALEPLYINPNLKYNPSKSVPGTPLPYFRPKIDAAKNYRSYPSTPLATSETEFTYSLGHDYLLNGQPVKEKIDKNLELDISFLAPSDNQDIDISFMNDTGILLGENKDEFNFEGQLSEDSFGAKTEVNPTLEENCVIINGYEFRNIVE